MHYFLVKTVWLSLFLVGLGVSCQAFDGVDECHFDFISHFGCCYNKIDVAYYSFCLRTTNFYGEFNQCIMSDPLNYYNPSTCDDNPWDFCRFYNCYTHERQWKDLKVLSNQSRLTIYDHLEVFFYGVYPPPIIDLKYIKGRGDDVDIRPESMNVSLLDNNYFYMYNMSEYGSYELSIYVPGYLTTLYYEYVVEEPQRPVNVVAVTLGTIIPVGVLVFSLFYCYQKKLFCCERFGTPERPSEVQKRTLRTTLIFSTSALKIVCGILILISWVSHQRFEFYDISTFYKMFENSDSIDEWLS